MDELTLLSEFRSEMSGPTAAETDAARAALIAAMAQVRPGQPRTKPSGRRFWLPLAAGTCAAAVGIAAAAVVASGPRPIRPAAKPAVLTAAIVLRKAASAAASQAAGHGRFFVSESEYIDPSNGRDVPAQRTIWIGNGVTGRLLDRGWGATGSPIPPGLSFGRGVITWSQLLSLPTAPGPLLAKIAGASRDNGQPLVQAEFATIVGLLFESPTTPALRAALYLAASRLPGVTLVPAAHDLIGRAAAEVYVPPGFAGNGGDALFFDPSTSAVLGVATLVGSNLQCPPAWEAAVLAAGYVNSTFQLPAGAPASLRPVTWRRAVPGCPASASGQPSASPSPS
ncbi:MAG TPA: CU044_5270 family protein [Streptosporangiaceae bacterium]|jgi:hypothetical protein|nr:CU044_5270 family protein [Streptosporangiaceae bacterium]